MSKLRSERAQKDIATWAQVWHVSEEAVIEAILSGYFQQGNIRDNVKAWLAGYRTAVQAEAAEEANSLETSCVAPTPPEHQ